MTTRRLKDDTGLVWEVRVISTGNSSAYLNAKVQRPIVEFRCVGVSGPTRYAMLAKALPDSLDQIDDDVLMQLFERSKSH